MTTTEQRLADALRTIDEQCQTGLNSSVYSHWSAALEDVMRISREAIAAYDAQQAADPMAGVHTAHDKLSAALEDPDAANDDVRDAAVDLCDALNALEASGVHHA